MASNASMCWFHTIPPRGPRYSVQCVARAYKFPSPATSCPLHVLASKPLSLLAGSAAFLRRVRIGQCSQVRALRLKTWLGSHMQARRRLYRNYTYENASLVYCISPGEIPQGGWVKCPICPYLHTQINNKSLMLLLLQYWHGMCLLQDVALGMRARHPSTVHLIGDSS